VNGQATCSDSSTATPTNASYAARQYSSASRRTSSSPGKSPGGERRLGVDLRVVRLVARDDGDLGDLRGGGVGGAEAVADLQREDVGVGRRRDLAAGLVALGVGGTERLAEDRSAAGRDEREGQDADGEQRAATVVDHHGMTWSLSSRPRSR